VHLSRLWRLRREWGAPSAATRVRF
jgi:hypothetical protein